MTRRLFLLVVLVLGLTLPEAGAGECTGSPIASPYDNWIADGTTIRLHDASRRANYARALMEKIDRLYVASTTSFEPTDIRLTSLYAFVAGDPMNVRRFVSTRAQAQRMRSLRRDLFGIAAAGVAGTPPPAPEAQGIRELLDDDAAARLMRSHWLSEFPAFVINNGTSGKLREYWRLKANAGDYLFDEGLYDGVQLIDLADRGTAIRSFYIDAERKLAMRTEKSMDSALSALYENRSTVCNAQFDMRRLWLNRRFLEKYASADRTGNVHVHGQISAWDNLQSAGMDDPTLFPLIREAYIVSAVMLRVSGDIVTVERLRLTPLVASQH